MTDRKIDSPSLSRKMKISATMTMDVMPLAKMIFSISASRSLRMVIGSPRVHRNEIEAADHLLALFGQHEIEECFRQPGGFALRVHDQRA